MKRLMKNVLLLIAGFCLIQPAVAEDAKEILKKVDEATRAVKAVRYKATVTPSGAAANFAAPAEGSGFMSGWDGSGPQNFYCRVKTKKRGSEEMVELEGGGNGDTYFLIDHGTKKAYEDMDPMVFGSGGQAVRGFGMAEFVHPEPFNDELNAEAEFQGKETLNGEECYKIHVSYAGMGASTWFFSTEDYLPRRRVRHFSTPQGEGAIEITMTELELDVEADPGAFKLKLPEGYEQIDDFAP